MWNLGYASSMVALGLLGQVVLGALLLPLAGVDTGGEIAPEDLPGWWSALIMVGVNVLLLADIRSRHRRDRRTGGAGFPSWGAPRLGEFALALGIGGGAFLFNLAFSLYGPLDITETAFARSFRTPVDFAALGVAVLIAAPLFEEVVFRGLLFHALLPRGRALTVVLTTVVFALPHAVTYREAPLALVPLTLLGLGLGALRLRTNAVLPCVIAHAFFNALGYGSALLGS